MPKIIPNLEKNILEAAWGLFLQEGYEQASIRKLASILNIAPGTIYNYFSTKDEIYFRIFADSWQKTKQSVTEIIKKPLPEDEKDEMLIRKVYGDVRQRREALYAAFSSEWKIKRFGETWREYFRESPAEVLAEMFSGSPEALRSGTVFLHGIRGVLAQFPGEDEKNITYLTELYRLMKRGSR